MYSKSTEPWQSELAESFESAADLQAAGLITPQELTQLQTLDHSFKTRITPYYARLIEPKSDCPIRRQAIPDLGEKDPILPSWATQASQQTYSRPVPWIEDSIGDLAQLAAPRLTHRYKNRALIHLSSTCAMYCRFCFRKSHLSTKEKQLYSGPLDPAYSYLRENPEITEVILTGGDPLAFQDSYLESVLQQLNSIESLRIVRIHSRMPVTLPSRISTGLIKTFNQNWNFNLTLVSHFNHPKELSFEATTALKKLRYAGVTLLNQSVLLKKVNASVDCLKALFQGLYERGVIPYYLHHPDWTPGTFDFRIPIEEGRQLMQNLRGEIAGPALPDYILDIPQGYGKISLLNSTLIKIKEWSPELSIGGALYQITPPMTRSSPLATREYLDLYSIT